MNSIAPIDVMQAIIENETVVVDDETPGELEVFGTVGNLEPLPEDEETLRIGQRRYDETHTPVSFVIDESNSYCKMNANGIYLCGSPVPVELIQELRDIAENTRVKDRNNARAKLAMAMDAPEPEAEETK